MKLNWHIVSEKRDELFGIAILGVFCVHSNGFVWPEGMSTVVRLLSEGSIGVDIFLFLSGMGLYYSMKKANSITAFYHRRFKRVIPTYLLIAGIGYAIIVFELEKKNITSYLFQLSTLSFWGEGDRIVWYISFIIIMYLLYPLIFKLLQSKQAEFILIVLIIFALVGSVGIATFLPALFSNIELALDRIVIFVLGAFCAPLIYEAKEMKRINLAIWGLCFILMRVVRVLLIDSTSIYCEIFVRMSNVFLTLLICFIGACLMNKCLFLSNIFRWFGRMSLELYLTHSFAIRIWSGTSIGLGNGTVVAYFAIILPISVLISAGIYYGREKMKKCLIEYNGKE